MYMRFGCNHQIIFLSLFSQFELSTFCASPVKVGRYIGLPSVSVYLLDCA